MRISARNALPGTIVEIKKGATTAHVRIDVSGNIVTASITSSPNPKRFGTSPTAEAL